MRRALDRLLLGGVSLLALMTVSDLGEARSLTPGSNTVAPTATAQQAAIAAAQQAAGAAAQAQASLARAAAALAAMRKLQLDAAALAQPSSVPNGVQTGGLMPLNATGNSKTTIDCGTACTRTTTTWQTDPSWINANGPVETVQSDNPRVTVDITQTQAKAILNWQTFNVGANTTVNFKQNASDWIALNRVLDPSAAPSRILGQVNAPGAVYLINRNGIIFGAGSQVNVHTLVASSLDVGKLGTSLDERNTYFNNIGIANPDSFSIYDPDGGAQTKLIAGDIRVERGASITGNIKSDVVQSGSPGAVHLFGANVYNSGSITVPAGQVSMVAARTVEFVTGGYSALPEVVLGKDSKGEPLKLRGTEFLISQFASSYSQVVDDPSNPLGYPTSDRYLAGTGTVGHDGLIDASRGIVVMNGDRIAVENPKDTNGGSLRDAAGNLVQGVISVDTGIERNAMVLLRAATSVTMNGVISSLPFDDGSTLPSGTSSGSSVQSFAPAYIEMTAQSTVTVGSSGLVSAPSAQVSLGAVNIRRTEADGQGELPIPNLFNQGGNSNVSSNSNSAQAVLLAPGATIDVAGLENVVLPAHYNFISFQPRSEFADMPLQRTGLLYGEELWIDIRNSGTYSDGTRWVGTPLANASDYVSNVGRSIYQLVTAGGSVSLKTDLTTNNGGGSVQTAGSVINVAGGSVRFEAGMVNSTRLLGADGRIYNMANADPNMTYVGIAGQFTREHARWGVTETWSTGTQVYSPGYTEGRDAGSVNVTTLNPMLAGTIYFGSVAGERQINSGLLPSQGSLALTTPSSVQIGSVASANYTTQSAVTTNLSADVLSGYGLSALSITANDLVVSGGSRLNLAAGGSFSVLAGGAIDIAGTVSAAGGSIDLVTDRVTVSGRFGTQLFQAPNDQSGAVIAANVFIGGTLDVSGRFVNDIGRTTADVAGPAFIDGGTISITTNKSSNAVAGINADTTGSILLAGDSVLDVSSGGYISPQGKPRTVSPGVMEGKAGSISLAIYQGKTWNNDSGPFPPHPTSKVAVLGLDGKLVGYGFESNASLRLAGADTIRIGGTLQTGETSSIRIDGTPSTLPESLLTGGGFGAYIIEAVRDDYSGVAANIVVSTGTRLTLQQQNLASLADYRSAATGTKLGAQTSPTLALLPDDQRKPVDLTLKADNILLDTGSTIVTDPKARITFGAINAPMTDATRNVPAQSVKLFGSIIDHGGVIFINALRTHLGSQALIDLSGTFVANSRFGTLNGPSISGSYLAGGTFSVEAGEAAATSTGGIAYKAPSSSSYLVAETGARVDVSGVAGEVQVAGARGTTSSLWWWTDAGKVSADISRFAWGGSLAASGGRYTGSDGTVHADSRASGGTFMLGGGAIELRQDMAGVSAALSAFGQGAGAAPSSLLVAADQLAEFDNVYLYAASAVGGATRVFSDQPGVLYGSEYAAPAYVGLTIAGPLDWNVANRLEIAAGTITASTPVDAKLSAAYVMLTGGSGSSPQAGSSTLTVKGQTIDVEGAAFSRFSQVNLISSGDIRLSTPRVVNGNVPSGTEKVTEFSTFAGSMASAGDFLLSAQRIYPVSAVNFTIKTPGDVTFAAPAGSNTAVPLSAGGSITVFAKNIVQGGNLFAPLGKIALGSTDSSVSDIRTEKVILAPGSLTSVTLADTVVPYGATTDGTGWYYNASLDPLALPPSKGIVLAGNNVERSGGSTIDLRGGGDLQAMEWIQGKGGSRDTLMTTPSGQTVYALLPSSDAVSAFDIHFTTARSADAGKTITAGDAYPLAGTQITIDGGNGIPAGTYTLYPAHYATLPGAMRVVYYGSNVGRNVPTGTSLPDGTVLVSGHYTQSAGLGRQSAGESLFAVQTGAVWQQYSEYSFNRANSYFTQQAAKQNLPVPRLPIDAGRLAVSALQSIVLNGIALTQPGRDSSGNFGRGGELDISAPRLAVVGHAGYVNNDIPTGYVGLDVAQLDGFESILIGGMRSDTKTGTLITPDSDSVLVDTRGETFSAPEILLVAQAAEPAELQIIPQTVTVNGQAIAVEDKIFAPGPDSGTVKIATGSVIKTTGAVHAGAGRNYYFAEPKSDFASGSNGIAATAQQIAAALGGTLDASGTVITGADISKLNYVLQNADGSVVTNPDGSVYRNTGNASAVALLQNYSYQTKGLNALFVASNDSGLKISGPTKLASPSLTVQFASSTDPNATGPTNGVLVLPDAGRVHIESGASITTKSLTLHATATANSIVGNSSDLHVGQLNISARTIGLGSSTIVGDKSVALYNQQFADVQALSLKALSGIITIYGDYNPGVVSKLTLDAATLVRSGNGGSASVSVNGIDSSITLVNTGLASAPTSSTGNGGGSTLSFNASEIVLGGGSQAIRGYGEVNLVATDRVFVAGPGSLTLGAGAETLPLPADAEVVNFYVGTPRILVAGATSAGSGSFAVSTLGNIIVSDLTPGNALANRPADSAETGGNLSLTGGNVIIGSTIQAQAGTITLEAATGDVSLAPGAYLAAAGYTKTLVDVDTYLSGGKVVLKSRSGNVWTDALSVIDVAQPAGGFGYGGDIEVTALGGNATLAGILHGSGGPGLGGGFKLDIKGAADLTALADKLLGAGITGAIDIHTRTGNLVLQENHTLKANAVTLTADDATWGGDASQQFGRIVIGGRIDATGYGGKTLNGAGQAGGTVALYGANEVLLASSGVIDASTTHADERGGDVTVGIGWAAKSKIFLQQGTQINVSGGTKGGLSGGTVTFRAPLDGNNDVKIAALSNVQNSNGGFDELPFIDATNDVNDRSKIGIIGARSVAVSGFIAFDTHASGNGIDGSSLGWSGRIDPAGWYNPDGTVVTSGAWTNISGWQISGVSGASAVTVVPPDAVVSVSGASGGSTNIKLTPIMGLSKPTGFPPRQVQVQISGPLSPNSTYTLVFDTPAGGVAGQATVSTDANGQIDNSTFTITNPGRGYTSAPTTATVSGLNVMASLVDLRMLVVSAQIAKTSGAVVLDPKGIAITDTSALTAAFGSATVRFTLGTGFSGRSTAGLFTADTGNYIPLTSSGVYAPFNPASLGTANFIGDATPNRSFFTDTIAQVTQGTWSHNNQNYGFSNLFARLQPLVDHLGSNVVHVQPGIELVNTSSTVNSGNITVASNWNLAAGTAGNLQTATVNNQTFQYFDPASSYVNFNYRLATPWGGLDAGALTLRAAGNIDVNASISDGFFQFGNYLDPNYVAAVAAYLGSSGTNRTIDQTGGLYTYFLNNLSSAPIAPYQAAGNSISPGAQDLVTADLFPHALRVCTVDCSQANIKTVTSPSSWSYAFTAGADVSSANPMARVALADVGGKGDVTVNNHGSYSQRLNNDATGAALAATEGANSITINLPTMVRTGTGNIAIAAARDVKFTDTVAPGVIYAAGVNTARLPDASYSVQTIDGVSRVVAGNPDGFFEPRILAYGNGAIVDPGAPELYYGPPTAAAFPEMGGDVVIDAQRDIIGNASTGNKVLQYYQPWLLSNAGMAPASSALTGGSLKLYGAGVFAPSGMQIASQTAWWIQYGSFQQGILSAGGNVAVTAGRDLIDVSVSLPTTGRVSGGLSVTSTPVTHIHDSGNMVVRAGRDILGGSFYEGSGHAVIAAGRTIGQNGTVSRFKASTLMLRDVPLLAVDTGQIEMTARRSIEMAGVVNPAGLHAQTPSFANPLETSNTASLPLYMTTYGPDSLVRLVAQAGDLTITVAPTAVTDQTKGSGSALPAAAAIYPASFEALALAGDLITTGITEITNKGSSVAMPGIVLSQSEHGTFNLLAQGSIDLTFGYPNNVPLFSGTPRPFISAGTSLIDTAFDPYQPNSGFTGAFSGAILAHQDDGSLGIDTLARIYAVTGDITATGGYGRRTNSASQSEKVYQHIEINRPTKVHAGRDIVDLNIIVQNIHSGDVSTIEAGRNIFYTGFNNGGGLQVAGPGFFVVQAGGDIGPFLPAAHNNATEATVQEGIVSVGNSSPTAVGNIYVSGGSGGGGSVGIYDEALLGPISNPRRNALLTAAAGTTQGADIITMFGTKFGVDYQAVIDAYINPNPSPAAPSVDHNYIAELTAFLARVGKPASAPDAANVFAAFKALPADLQHVFVDQVFFAELKAVGIARKDGASFDEVGGRAYQVINTMFPSSLGYTTNSLDHNNKPAQLVSTGNLDMRHATVQTQLGGDISIFGPGGNIIAGSLAIEPNTSLKLRDLGVLTLGGGSINTFTDQSVLVNSSRVLTTQGGDILMFSSNLNLDAGRGSKTTLSAPALQVLFDQNAYQSVDLGGFVTGAGIATLQASTFATSSTVYLMAPRGEIDFGTAGVRSSGDLVVVAPVVANASNISVQGAATGVPVVSMPNVGALTAGSNTAGAAAKSADTPTAGSGNQDRASFFIVEVMGYGGGSQELPSADGNQPSGDRSSEKDRDKEKQ